MIPQKTNKSQVLFIGGINYHNKPRGGEEAKNQIFIDCLKSYNYHPAIIDTFMWERNILRIIFKMVSKIIIKKKETSSIIVSKADDGAYTIIRLLLLLVGESIPIHYFVIGGDFTNRIASNTLPINVYYQLDHIIVESLAMKNKLKCWGLDNVQYYPNFKKIPTIPLTCHDSRCATFLFLSRINIEKGVELIFEACQILNDKRLGDKYTISFYGFIDDYYKDKFMKHILDHPNTQYLGYINMNTDESYKTLSQHSAMLFPTYHYGEGFPGVLIDAMIAGIPIIASKWGYNAEIVNKNNGFLFEAKSSSALAKQMERVIRNLTTYDQRKLCQVEAQKYDVNRIIPKYARTHSI